MCRPNVIGVIVPPRSAHTFGFFVVGYHVVVIRELLVADGTRLVLLDNFSIQELSHLCR